MPRLRPLSFVLLALVGGCSTSSADTPTGTGSGTTGEASESGSSASPSSTATNDPSASSASSATDGGPEGSSEATSTAGTPLPVACDELCDPYQECDEGVFLSCQANCRNTVALGTFDPGCGTAADAYMTCRYTLSCEDAIADHRADEPLSCVDLLDPYIEACTAAAPPACDGYCESILNCLELQNDPASQLGCKFECLLYFSYGAATGTPECDASVDAAVECVAEAECEDQGIVGCDEQGEALVANCDLP